MGLPGVHLGVVRNVSLAWRTSNERVCVLAFIVQLKGVLDLRRPSMVEMVCREPGPRTGFRGRRLLMDTFRYYLSGTRELPSAQPEEG
jgi:hypothetical protein